MKFIIGLLVLLAFSIVLGVIRKLRGGTFLPQPAPDEDHVVYDKNRRPWRYDPKSGVWEELFRRPKKT